MQDASSNDQILSSKESEPSLHDRLASNSDKLTAADKRIWAELSRDPTLAVFQSTEAIAAGAEVNQASVVRFAQKLGYSGFVELRGALRDKVRDTTSPAQRLRKLVDTPDRKGGSLAAHLAHQADALAIAATTLSDRAFEDAADALAAARTVYVFASGHATALAELALRRLSRIGCHVVDLRGATRDVIERVARMNADDVLLAFAFRTPSRHLAVLLDIAVEREAAIVALTDVFAPDMERPRSQILAASRGRSGDYQTLTVPLAVMEALAIAIATRAPERATDALHRIGAAAVARTWSAGSNQEGSAAPHVR